MADENRWRKKLDSKRIGLDQQCKERTHKSYREDNEQKKADEHRYGGLTWHEKTQNINGCGGRSGNYRKLGS